jgi:hypothetical protein
MGWARAALALVAVGAAGALLVSGGAGGDPATPAGLPGMPAPFLGTAVVGSGGLTAAVDAYGDVVDLRARPGGMPLIDYSSARQAAGSVPSDTGIVPRVVIGSRAPRPLWRADGVRQRYLPRTNVLQTVARFGRVRVTLTDAASEHAITRAVSVMAPRGVRAKPLLGVNLEGGLRCTRRRGFHRLELACVPAVGSARRPRAGAVVRSVAAGDRRWLTRARPLGPGAPLWAWRLYERSLLTLRSLTDARSGASVAGARDGWAYVWPRDAAATALALAAAGYRPEARQVARFLIGLNLGAAARFFANGAPVPGRGPQGDSRGWTEAAARAARLAVPGLPGAEGKRSDYWEEGAGEYLGNAIAKFGDGSRDPRIAFEIEKAFGSRTGLVRKIREPGSGLDSAAAWAVRPFPIPPLQREVRETLLHLLKNGTRFGITPGEGWPGTDPWSAPTAWTAWSLASLGNRRQARHLLADLRRAATSAGTLPERVDARTGIPRSTTPLAWSHAFAILALQELWPQR